MDTPVVPACPLEGLILTVVAIGAVLAGIFVWAIVVDVIGNAVTNIRAALQSLRNPPDSAPKWARVCGHVAYFGWVAIIVAAVSVGAVVALNVAAGK